MAQKKGGKAKIKVKKSAQLRKKSEGNSIPKLSRRIPQDNGASIKIRVKRG